MEISTANYIPTTSGIVCIALLFVYSPFLPLYTLVAALDPSSDCFLAINSEDVQFLLGVLQTSPIRSTGSYRCPDYSLVLHHCQRLMPNKFTFFISGKTIGLS